MSFTLTSPAFASGAPIPKRFSGDGEDRSPPLEWRDPPPGARSFVLTVEDPDAPGGTFHHWTLLDIPAEYRKLPEGFPGDAPLGSMRELENGFGHEGYGGPLPPHGHGVHHYRFALHALSTETVGAESGETPTSLKARIRPLTLATAELVGTYER